jgi:hypothetical protein
LILKVLEYIHDSVTGSSKLIVELVEGTGKSILLSSHPRGNRGDGGSFDVTLKDGCE